MSIYVCSYPRCPYENTIHVVKRHYIMHLSRAILKESGLEVRCPVNRCSFTHKRVNVQMTSRHFAKKHPDLDPSDHLPMNAYALDDRQRTLHQCLAEVQIHLPQFSQKQPLPVQRSDHAQPQIMEPRALYVEVHSQSNMSVRLPGIKKEGKRQNFEQDTHTSVLLDLGCVTWWSYASANYCYTLTSNNADPPRSFATLPPFAVGASLLQARLSREQQETAQNRP